MFVFPNTGTIEGTAEVMKKEKDKSIIESFSQMISEASQKFAGLGFVAGGEFTAAVEEARKLSIPVLLGDRDVDDSPYGGETFGGGRKDGHVSLRKLR
eukprot:gene36328-47277_t